MRYLITGHKGFIGTNLTNYLEDFGHEVDGIDYPYDLCKMRAIKLNIDIVVHLAAETNIRYFIGEPERFIKNCQSTQTALEFARLNSATFIFASSCGVSSISNSYAASKLAGEALCHAYHKSYGTPIRILRFSNVYGPYSNHKDSVITKFIKAKLSNIPIVINGTGDQKRDFVHVSDVCKAIHRVKDNYMEISTGRLTSILELSKMLDIKDISYESFIRGEVSIPLTKPWPWCDINLESGLASTLKWFKDN